MASRYRHCSVRLDWRQHERLEAVARMRATTPSDLIREAVSSWLDVGAEGDTSRMRLARVSEFAQLALDVIIREHFPEYRDRVLAETDRRMAQYHGPR